MPRTSYEFIRCPICGSSESTEIADSEAMRFEVESLWAFHEARLREGVPTARLADRVAFSQYPPLRLAQCKACSHLYRNPSERHEALEATYNDAILDEGVLQALFETQRETYRAQAERITAIVGHAGRGLEVGSYVGGFLAAAHDIGWVFEGLDVNASALKFARKKGFPVTRGEITEFVTEHPFDVIAIWNTFEQLYDVRAGVTAARRLLRVGGLLAVRTPNAGFYVNWRNHLRGPLSGVAIRMLAHNNLLSFPYRQGFTKRSLFQLFIHGGFEIVDVFGDTLVPIADSWTTKYGTAEERLLKHVQRIAQRGWHAPWIEVYARAI